MKEQDPLDSRCLCWEVGPPERGLDFAQARSCCEARDCACRNRLCGTILLLLFFSAVGGAVGVAGARRQDAANLAVLRDIHLHSMAHGGDR